MSLIIGKKYQRPSVVENLKLAEYSNEKHMGVVYVEEHKTGLQGPAYFKIDSDDRLMFEAYLKYVRPERYILLLYLVRYNTSCILQGSKCVTIFFSID